jgi:hypothetical protein
VLAVGCASAREPRPEDFEIPAGGTVSDYFDRVEQGLREALQREAHLPWYLRLRPRFSRPLIVALACLLIAGSALAATGLLRTGEPVGATVPPIPNAYEGATIPGTAHLLALRVADPGGGPPWGLRELRTTRGLMCVQLGRVVNGRLGVLGQDGAFHDDGAFHPLSADFLDGIGCGTEDARGNAFVNEQIHALPASALTGDEQHISGGCYRASPKRGACPPQDLRDVYYGLLGPDAVSVTHTTQSGVTVTTPTVGRDGAYLVVLSHSSEHCVPGAIFCAYGEGTGYSGNPELGPSETIRAVNYRHAPTCHIPTPGELAQLQVTQGAALRAALRARFPRLYGIIYSAKRSAHGSSYALTRRESNEVAILRARLGFHTIPTCPAVGYVPIRTHHTTHAQLASRVTVHAELARFYCEKRELTVPCNARIPTGFRRLDMRLGPPQVLLVVEFTARAAVRNFDSHYEINISNPYDPANRKCPGPGGGSFGPTQRNLRAGQRVRFTQFANRECRGVSHITVGFVTVDGPSGSTPVPGLPGQSGEIPVGSANFWIP